MIMIKELETLKREVNEMRNIIIDLGELETGENADYTDIIEEITWNKVMLNNRLIQLREQAR